MIEKPAQTQIPISELLANRWSPRVFDENYSLTDEQTLRLQEAARWAPSGNNAQPWKFAFIPKDHPVFTQISEVGLTGFNQSWAPKASMYVACFAARTKPDGSVLDKHSAYFNNALATSQIVFEAEALGLKAHYMGGIQHKWITELLGVEDMDLTILLVIGKQGELDGVESGLKEREQTPRTRKPLAEILVQP